MALLKTLTTFPAMQRNTGKSGDSQWRHDDQVDRTSQFPSWATARRYRPELAIGEPVIVDFPPFENRSSYTASSGQYREYESKKPNSTADRYTCAEYHDRQAKVPQIGLDFRLGWFEEAPT